MAKAQPKPTINWQVALKLPDSELQGKTRVDSFIGSGSGGQKRNKTANAIRLTYGELTVQDSSSRSKPENLKKALKKLRICIALDFDLARIQTKPCTNCLHQYIQAGLIRINPKNPEYPLFLGEYITLLFWFQKDYTLFAKELQTSKSQLSRFADKEPLLKQAIEGHSNLLQPAQVSHDSL